jgi:hypothetical protein
MTDRKLTAKVGSGRGRHGKEDYVSVFNEKEWCDQ